MSFDTRPVPPLRVKILEILNSKENETYLRKTFATSNNNLSETSKKYIDENFVNILQSYLSSAALENARDLNAYATVDDKIWAIVRHVNYLFLRHLMTFDVNDTANDTRRYDFLESMLRASDIRYNKNFMKENPEPDIKAHSFDRYHSTVMSHWDIMPDKFTGSDRMSSYVQPMQSTQQRKSGFVSSGVDSTYERVMLNPEIEQRTPQYMLPLTRRDDSRCTGSDGSGEYKYGNLLYDEIIAPNGVVTRHEPEDYGDMILKSLPPSERRATERESYLFRIGRNKYNDGAIPFYQNLTQRNMVRKDLNNPFDQDDMLDRSMSERNNIVKSGMSLQAAGTGGMQMKPGSLQWKLGPRTQHFDRDDEPSHFATELGCKVRGYPISSMLNYPQVTIRPERTHTYGTSTKTPCCSLRCNSDCDAKITYNPETLLSGPS